MDLVVDKIFHCFYFTYKLKWIFTIKNKKKKLYLLHDVKMSWGKKNEFQNLTIKIQTLKWDQMDFYMIPLTKL